jgi:hypothetical protein
MRAHDLQVRMQLQQVIARREDGLFARPFLVQIRMLVGMLLVVTVVGARRVERLRAGVRFGDVRDDRLVMRGDVVEDGPKAGSSGST